MVKISVLKGVAPTKIFQQYQVTRSKLPFQNALLYVPRAEIQSIMRRAAATGELTPQLLEQALLLMIKRRCYDRSQIMIKCWTEDLHRSLTPIHIQMAMNLAAQTRHWQEALEWWRKLSTVPRTQLSPDVYSTIFKALNQGKLWKEALILHEHISADGTVIPDSTQHALLTTLRRNGPWDVALKKLCKLRSDLFNSDEMAYRASRKDADLLNEVNFECIGASSPNRSNDLEENPHFLTEILHVLQYSLIKSSEAAQQKLTSDFRRTIEVNTLRNRLWLLALRIYSAPKKRARTTALQNACVEILSRSHRWQKAFTFLSDNLHRKRQFPAEMSQRVLTPETLRVLLPCLKSSTCRLSAVLEVACQHKVQVPSEYLESLFLSILHGSTRENNGQDCSTSEAIECFLRLKEMSLQSTDGPFGYHVLCMAFSDALLNCQNSEAAFSLACHFKELLEEVVSSQSEGISKIGSEHTINIVEGKIAVMDNFFTSSLTKNRLGKLFDAIFVPYAVIRRQVRLLTGMPSMNHADGPSRAANFINNVRRSDLGDKLINVSFLTQLQSHIRFSGKPRRILLPSTGDKSSHDSHRNHVKSFPESTTTKCVKNLKKNEVFGGLESSQQLAPTQTPKHRKAQRYAEQIFAVALNVQCQNVDSRVYLITQSSIVFSHFETLCQTRNSSLIPIWASSYTVVEKFFSENPDHLNSQYEKESLSRTMDRKTIALNV